MVTDLLRAKIFVSGFAQMEAVLEALRELAAKLGLVVVHVKNRTGECASELVGG